MSSPLFCRMSFLHHPALRPIAAAALLTAGAAAHASFTAYTSQASFAAAVAAPAVDNFDGISASFLVSPATRSAGAYSYRATAAGDFYVLNHSASDNWLSTFGFVPVTLNNFSASVRGVGGFFFGVDAGDNVLPTRTITIVATDASGASTQTITNASDTKFFGLVSTGSITSLAISVSGSGAYVTMNDITLGAAAVVPEPTSGVLLASGLTGVIGATLRRRRRLGASG